ncbi:MAG: hypothetical protein FRX49_00644 [Trebouxia sp. A1-2]|nr:MAG: hypothetical protein FRX49_00644 [Trebouxia sp. A1-2]
MVSACLQSTIVRPTVKSQTPSPLRKKFERDLGGGRKLQTDSSTKNNASRVTSGRQGGPTDSADARDAPDMKVTGGGLPGISKSLPKSSTSAPIS